MVYCYTGAKVGREKSDTGVLSFSFFNALKHLPPSHFADVVHIINPF